MSCLRLLWHEERRAFSRARAKTGKRMAARIAMIAMTTSSSIRVKPDRGRDDLPNISPSFRVRDSAALRRGVDRPMKHGMIALRVGLARYVNGFGGGWRG